MRELQCQGNLNHLHSVIGEFSCFGMTIIIFLVCVSWITASDSARILAAFPTPSISHQVVFRPLTVELAKRGHDVTVLTADPAFPKGQTPVNYSEIDVHDISYDMWKEFIQVLSGEQQDAFTKLKMAMERLVLVFEEQIKTLKMQSLLNDKNQKFDLIFIETCVKSSLALSYVYKAPVIQFSSFGALPGFFQTVGAPIHPGLYPLSVRQKVVNLTMWDKIREYYDFYKHEKYFVGLEELENEAMKRVFGPHLPSMSDLSKNIQMHFLNIHPLWDFNRPVPPNVLYLGGLHQKPEKELPKKWKTYLDSSKNGVIYMSLGTNIQPSFFPPEKIQIFTKVFGSLPYNVLWKWDKEELEGKPSNVQISKWFPQSDLLKHPNIKLFITQGGLQSSDEAITAGVPLVAIPMLGDQWYNADLYMHYKIGVKLNYETLTEQVLKNAIDTVLNKESYRANVIKLRAVMRDQPMTPLERAVWWTEHVLRHGGAGHLRAPAANMHWTQYYEIELLLLILMALAVILITLVTLVKFIVNFLNPNKKVKEN